MVAQVIVNEADQLYAGQEFGDFWSDIAAGLNKNSYCRVVLRGEFTMSTACDFTSFRGGVDVDASTAKLVWDGGNAGTMIDLADTSGSRWVGLRMTNDSTHRPDTAIQMGRTSGQAYRSAGKHTFIGLDLAGWFGTAAVYNVTSETCAFVAARIENLYTSGRYAVFLGDQARAGDVVPNPFSKPLDSIGSTSSSGGTWTACRIQHEGTEAAVYVYGFDRQVFADCYIQASGDADAQVIIDTTPKGVIQTKFKDVYFHGSTQTSPAWTCIVRGKKNSGVQGLVVDARQDGTDGSGGFFKIEDNADPQKVVGQINGLVLRGMASQAVEFRPTSKVYNAVIDSRQDLDAEGAPNITLGAVYCGEVSTSDASKVVATHGAVVSATVCTPDGVRNLGGHSFGPPPARRTGAAGKGPAA